MRVMVLVKANRESEAVQMPSERLLPFEDGDEIEIRPLFGMDDFGKEFTPALRSQEEALRARIGQA